MTIKEQLNNIDWSNHKQVINFYDSNLLYFENYKLITDQEKISELIDIKLHYSNSLFENSHYEKVLIINKHVKELLAKLPVDHWNFEESDRHADFLKGMALGYMKKHREAYNVFVSLIKKDPDHYYYRLWYNHSKLGIYNWFFNGLAISGAILVFGDLFFDFSKNLTYDLGIIGWIVLLGSYLTQQGLKLYFKRKKTATNISE